ncbi:DUF1499 domain-containing protein [Marinobacterium rhizophilum]|uniref:DUF1499 domain-containing protein n=1 Tax=Marinobacterium rhizophilum TaxID=420402 RepID=A0ABY5HI12_9GAMM|nr:DUF1499 domain-containing protein [Marinobacterium rhizophilum]UTW11609.1 DUF1499 domain-containing protein [Marinobacterium rhizophilum]
MKTNSRLTWWIPVLLYLAGCSSQAPSSLGVQNGRLAPCPDTPNCVGSEYPDSPAWIAPLSFTDSPPQAWARLQNRIQAQGGQIETLTDTYLWATYRSRLLRFIDDVEFRLDSEARQIQVRSASRLGYSDLGVNRKRIEDLRSAFARD